jgi:hypothetical protein
MTDRRTDRLKGCNPAYWNAITIDRGLPIHKAGTQLLGGARADCATQRENWRGEGPRQPAGVQR